MCLSHTQQAIPLTYQFFVVRDPGYKVDELVVADGVGLEEALQELVAAPQDNDNSVLSRQIHMYNMI